MPAGSGWLNDPFSIVWKMVYLIKAKPHVNTSPTVQNEIIQLCSHVIVSPMSGWTTQVYIQSAFFQMGVPRQEACFSEFDCIWCLVIVSSCMCIYTQDFQLRVHPDPLHLLLCAYGGSRSVRVQVAHGRERWPGSRLAAPVSIWCWQFTQALFSTGPGRINTLFPFSEGSISQPQG